MRKGRILIEFSNIKYCVKQLLKLKGGREMWIKFNGNLGDIMTLNKVFPAARVSEMIFDDLKKLYISFNNI